MCAIVDANVANEFFSPNRSEAEQKLYDWIDAATGRLVVGGKLLKELEKGSPTFREWASEFGLAGKMRIVNADQVNTKTKQIKSKCVSDDPHIIALAQISGARLLYTNDSELHKDFKNKKLIKQPRGKIYPTNEDGRFTDDHEGLLKQRKLCQQ